MKKLLFCLLVLVMSMTFVACGSDDDNNDNPTPTEAVTTPEATPEATPEVTPEATPEVTPEPTAVPTEAPESSDAENTKDGEDDLNVTPEVTPEADINPVGGFQAPELVERDGSAISEDGLHGTWLVDTDSFYELFMKVMLSEYEEGSAEYEETLNYIVENRAVLENAFDSVYSISMEFDGGIAYLSSNGETEEGLYELTEGGIDVYDADGTVTALIYDAEADRLVHSDIENGMEILFYKASDELLYSGITDIEPQNPAIDNGDLTKPDYSELTGDPINSIAEVAGNWIVDKKSLIEMFKAMFVAEEGENYSQEELEQLLAEGGMLDQMFSEAMLTMFISEGESYMTASGSVDEERLQNIYPVPAEFGLILYNADDLEDVTIPAIYNAAEDSLTVMDNEMGIKFFRE